MNVKRAILKYFTIDTESPIEREVRKRFYKLVWLILCLIAGLFVFGLMIGHYIPDNRHASKNHWYYRMIDDKAR